MIALALAVLLPAQKAPPGSSPTPFTELRFHRVHLRNGNFIDGDLVRQTPSTVVLRLKYGDMRIHRGLIERVEYVKMRGVQDKPEEVAAPKSAPFALAPAAAERRDPFARPRTPSTRPPSTAPKVKGAAPAPFTPSPELKAKVDPLIAKLPGAKDEDIDGLLREVAQLGNDTAPYLAALMEKSDPRLAELIGTILTQQTNADAVPYVLRLCTHPEELIRAQSAIALASNGGAGYAPEIAALGKDKSDVVRVAAVTALSMFDEESLWDPVAVFATDPDREVRTRALGTLARLADALQLKERWVSTLADLLDRSASPGLADVISAAGRAKDASLAPKVAAHLKDEDAAARSAAARALGELNDPETADELAAQMAAEEDPDVREVMAAAAETLKVRPAVETLIAWLGDETDRVKKAAEKALRAITKQNFGQDAEKWSAWWEENK